MFLGIWFVCLFVFVVRAALGRGRAGCGGRSTKMRGQGLLAEQENLLEFFPHIQGVSNRAERAEGKGIVDQVGHQDALFIGLEAVQVMP